MVMHRALFTYFILLIFFILLCLKLESHKRWNWFLIFLPMWIYDVISFLFALVHIIMHCKHGTLRNIAKNKDNLSLLIIILKMSAQIMLCLYLEDSANIKMYHVLIPVWILLPILIVDVSITLFRNSE